MKTVKFTSLLCLGLVFTLTASSNAICEEDKEYLIYSSLRGGFWQICVMDMRSKEEKFITRSGSDKRYPIWLDEERKIMYRTNNAEMFILDLKDGTETRVLSKFGVITDPAWSKAGQKLAFTRYEGHMKDESEIWTVNLDGSSQKVLTNEKGLQYNPAWSPDGKRIVYTSGKGLDIHELFVMNGDGSDKSQLTRNDNKFDILPVFSPDGSLIAFSSNRSGAFDIWLMDRDGGNPKNLTNDEYFNTKPSFSADGENIIFTSYRYGNFAVWTMNIYGSTAKRLTKKKSNCRDGILVRM